MPANRIAWAREVWADRESVARIESGAWMLREAARVLGLPEETADEVIAKVVG